MKETLLSFTIFTLATCVVVLYPPFANAQTDNPVVVCFTPAGSIPGTSTLEGFQGCIDATSQTVAVITPATTSTGGGAGASRPTATVRFTKAIDSASPTIFLATTTGTRFEAAEIRVLQVSGDGVTEVSRTTLSNVAITALQQQTGTPQTTAEGQTAMADTPFEEVTLSFTRMCLAVGTNSQCFDFSTGSAA